MTFKRKSKGMVPWKLEGCEADDDEWDGDFGLHSARLVNTMQTPEFINRDETNADAFKKLKLKPWFK